MIQPTDHCTILHHTVVACSPALRVPSSTRLINFEDNIDPMIRLDEKNDAPKHMSKFSAYISLVKGNVG